MQVSKEEYEDHIKNYKGGLEITQTEVVDPPLKSHKDIITKEIITTVSMNYRDSEGNVVEIDDKRQYEYYIIKLI